MIKNQQRVLVTGVFDILHQEHIAFLQKAKSLGWLIVGLESDARVRALKGPGRPINNQNIRQKNVEELQIADDIFILPEQFDSPEDHRRLLAELKPDILAVSENTPHVDKKIRLMQEIGGTLIVVHKHNPAISTTILLTEKQNNRE